MSVAVPSPAPVRAAALLGALALPLAVGPSAAHAEREPPPRPLVETVVEGASDPPEIGAEAYLLLDAATGQVLAEHRADERRPVASTVKVLTALTVLDRTAPDDVVEVGEEVQVGGASVGLEPGDEWTIEQLLDGLLLRSGNDAAEALAAHVAGDLEAFVELMLADAERLGLSGVTLTSVSGLDDGNRLSARDLAVLARVGLGDEELRPLLGRVSASLPGLGEVVTRNELLEELPDATGVKTGYTEAAGFSLVASAARDDRELVAVVLDAGEDPARFEDAAALLDHGFEAFENETLAASVRLLVGGGAHELVVEPTEVVSPAGAGASLALGPPVRPEVGDTAVDVEIGGEAVGAVRGVVAAGPEAVEGDAAVGRAMVDGVYAALRATTAADRW